ncbi:MAG: NAD(P)H-hydrate dehydratase [Candidatus Lokiarchaeota archaeon]|nr:NAD(P)H-hydrate dehydratase [Candidatus Lokiarchaeota archaeon]
MNNDVITPEDMTIVDMNTAYLGVPTILLMENAGRGITDAILENYPETIAGKKVVLFAGLGNNGGDGLVAIRHLSDYGCKSLVVLLGKPERIRSELARTNWEALQKLPLSVKLSSLKDSSQFKELKKEIMTADILIDGILGTGIKGTIREPIASAIKFINSASEKAFIAAIDVPTGLDPGTGKTQRPTVKANITVTFHRTKPGLILKKNAKYTGKVLVKKIGIPWDAEYVAGPGDLANVIKQRSPHSYKGNYGRILVVGGGKYYTGAPALSGVSALRTGADLVFVVTPSKIANSIRSFSPDLIVREIPGDVLSEEGMSVIEEMLDQTTCLVIGPGLGLEKETMSTVLKILETVKVKKVPTLVDADGLKAMSQQPTILEGVPAVLTPHAGEYKILTGKQLPAPEKIEKRMDEVMETAKELGVTILLKAHTDVISDGIHVKINRTGNPGMAVGGTGDVLTGIVGAFLSWGVSPFRAAVSGAFVNGVAGDLACVEKGYQLLASDLIEKIPDIIQPFEHWRELYKSSLQWLGI